MALDTDITIPELPTSTSESNNDLILLTQPNAQAETGYSSAKATTEVVAKKILGGIEFTTDLSNFPQNEQNPFDALNYLKQKIEEIYPVETVSGAIANFTTSLELPLVTCKAQIVPKETGTGTKSPSNPYTISGSTEANVTRCGVNVWDEVVESGSIDQTTGENVSDDTRIRSANYIPCKPSVSYYVVVPSLIGLRFYGKDKNYLSGTPLTVSGIVTPPANAYYIRFVVIGVNTYGNNISFNSNTSDTSYHVYNGDTHTIALGQTVYGGVCDVTGGQGEVTFSNMIDLGDFTWSTDGNGYAQTTSIDDIKPMPTNTTVSPMKCDKLITDTQANVYAKITDNTISGATNNTIMVYMSALAGMTAGQVQTYLRGYKCVYPLATPTSFSVTPTTIITKNGTNNIYADTGDIEVSFKQGVQEYIDKKIAETQALVL